MQKLGWQKIFDNPAPVNMISMQSKVN